MSRVTIIGAGMAGLLAANMLRRHDVSVLERQSELPNNHHAVLRFRSDVVSKQLHIPFREVRVFKGCDQPDPIKAAIQYAKKVTGNYEARSLIDLSTVTRWIAPPDLVQQMARDMRIAYDIQFDAGRLHNRGALISTMPMMALMDLLNYPGERPEFKSLPGWTVTATIRNCDMFVTKYITDPRHEPYRISITGDQLIVEGAHEPVWTGNAGAFAAKAAMELGLATSDVGEATFHRSRYAKIAKLSSADRRKAQQFMFWATTEHNIYSLGRFATWRAGLLLDDLVNDILMIERWMTFGPAPYEVSQLATKGN